MTRGYTELISEYIGLTYCLACMRHTYPLPLPMTAWTNMIVTMQHSQSCQCNMQWRHSILAYNAIDLTTEVNQYVVKNRNETNSYRKVCMCISPNYIYFYNNWFSQISIIGMPLNSYGNVHFLKQYMTIQISNDIYVNA